MFRTALRHQSTRTRHAVIAGVFAASGLFLLAGGAIADAVVNSESTSSIKLALPDTDMLSVSGKGLPSNAAITVTATSASHIGIAHVVSDKDGRIVLAFDLPDGTSGNVAVAASTGTSTSKSSIDVPAVPGSASTTGARLSDRLSGVNGVTDFNARLSVRDALDMRIANNSRTLAVLLPEGSTNEQSAAVTEGLTALDANKEALGTEASSVNAAISTLNGKASTTLTDAQKQALATEVAAASTSLDDQIRTAKLVALIQEQLIGVIAGELATTSPTTSTSTTAPASSTSSTTSSTVPDGESTTTTSTTVPDEKTTTTTAPTGSTASQFSSVPMIDLTPTADS